ncbi:MAG: VOC family protein [Verrucomicrobiota bacterium]
MIHATIPVIRVSKITEATAFYCDGLGFTREWAYTPGPDPDPTYMGLRRDGQWLHISSFSGDGVFGSAVYLSVDNVDELFREFSERQIKIHLEPTDQTWGNREMYIKDNDSNSIRFTQESAG